MRFSCLFITLICLVASWGSAQAPEHGAGFVRIGLDDCVPAHMGREICVRCHPADRFAGIPPYGACADCHANPHRGQLAHRPDGGACDACHDVLGFESVHFEVAEHRETEFPLEGAHQAVSCRACHKREQIDGVEVVLLKIATRQCPDCHEAPNRGHIAEVAERCTCRDCHTVQSWRAPVFDHERAEFKLTGKHVAVPCQRCHAKADAGTPREQVRYRNLGRNCGDCHSDVHAGQLTPKVCRDCHTTESWKPVGFDHQRDAAFALAGKHRDADCHVCHRLEARPSGKPLRRFKPLRGECRACHDEDGSVRPVFLGVSPAGAAPEPPAPRAVGGGR